MRLLYNLTIIFLVIISPVLILYRILKNKENPVRFIEKFGFIKKKEKKGN